jgi:hypothetical protein
MKLSIASAIAAATTVLFTVPTQATVINSAYTPLAGTVWLVELTVVNDGDPASITNFTVNFPSFTNLVLVATPASWDTLLIQPDPELPANGFLDSLAPTPADALTVGSLGGFRVQFNFGGIPGALPFVISDSSFTVLFSGLTTVTAVPEPTALLMAALGLGVVVGLGISRSRCARSAGLEIAACAGHRETAA